MLNISHKVVSFVFTCLFLAMYITNTHAAKHKVSYKPRRYAAIVVNARSGEVIDSFRPDLLCHPASLTKMMATYMLFEALKAGKISMSTKFTVSKRAARKPPGKLGLKAGSKVTVKTILFSMITKSANDAACVLAEGLAKTEEEFARKMTAKAKLLGMRHTVFMNSSGLPHPQQLTTARDMATLSIALLRDFPNMYGYFRTRIFVYKGRRYRNHNHLLGKVKGVEGIKTGFTNASGYNQAASATRYYNRRSVKLIVVVLGGPTWRWRDQRLTKLIEENFAKYKSGRLKISRYTPRPIQIQYKRINPNRPLARPNPQTINTVMQKIVLDQYVEDIVNQSRHTEVILPKPRVYSDDAIKDAMIMAQEHIICPKPRPKSELPIVRKICITPEARPTIEALPPTELANIAINSSKEIFQTIDKPLPRPNNKPNSTKPEARNFSIQIGIYDSLSEALKAARDKRSMLKLDNAQIQTQTLVKKGKARFEAQISNLTKTKAYQSCKYIRNKNGKCNVVE